MQVTRIYSNSAGDIIRIDTISIAVLPPIYQELRAGNDPGLMMRVGPQKVRTELQYIGTGYALGDRDVAQIDIIGDHDTLDETGSPYNFLWATRTLGNSQVIKFDMSNLPVNGDTV